MTRLRDGGAIYISAPYGIAKYNILEPTGATRAPDAPPWNVGYFQLDIYLDDYAAYWKIENNNTAEVVSSKSVTNLTPSRTTLDSPSPGDA